MAILFHIASPWAVGCKTALRVNEWKHLRCWYICELSTVASPRGGGKRGNLPPPPNLRLDTPWDRWRSEEILASEKNGGMFTGFARKFYMHQCNDGRLWSYDYEKEGVVEVVEGVTLVSPRWSCGALWDLSVLALALPSITFLFYYFIFIFKMWIWGPSQKDSGPNPMSFQFLTGGRLT